MDSAIEHLCDGKDYWDLSPIQKLCIFRILVEACYDSNRLFQTVQDNIKSRIGAVKQLENEERRVKKEAREESSRIESAARERLVEEAKVLFLMKKRNKLAKVNESSKKFTDEHLKNLTDEAISEVDEETKIEYDSLQRSQDFSKTKVNAMSIKMRDENALGMSRLEVLTLEEIQCRESNELENMEEELLSYGSRDQAYELSDRETSATVDKLKKEILCFKEWLVTLPETRSEAMDALKEAIDDGTLKVLKTAIKGAKEALLLGESEEEGVWALDLLRDAAVELKTAEKRKRVIEAQKDLVIKRNKCFIRTDQLGNDRFYNQYWQFDHDESSRIWIEADYDLQSLSAVADKTSCLEGIRTDNSALVTIGANDEEEDIISSENSSYRQEIDSFLQFSRKEYHSSAKVSSIVKQHYVGHSTDHSLRNLIKKLDRKGVREGPLKEAMKRILETRVITSLSSDTKQFNENLKLEDQPASEINNHGNYKTTCDETVFATSKKAYLESNE